MCIQKVSLRAVDLGDQKVRLRAVWMGRKIESFWSSNLGVGNRDIFRVDFYALFCPQKTP